MGGARGHHLDAFTRDDLAVDDAHVRHHTAVGVVDRVEDHRPRRSVGITGRRWHLADDVVEQVGDALARLSRHSQHIAGFAADDVGDLGGVSVRVGGGQIDLVEHRDDVQVAVQRQIEVRQRLRLDALGGVDQQHRTLARLQRPRHLVGEVDVARGVDQMQDIVDLPPTLHGSRTFWALMVMPRSRSMSIRSRYCARIERSSTTPVNCSIRSASVDLP